MKNIKILLFALVGLFTIIACETEDYDTVAEVEEAPGFIIDVRTGSTGAILVNPLNPDSLETSEVSVQEAYLTFDIRKTAGSTDQLEKVQVLLSFNDGEESVIAESTSVPFTVELESIEEILEGTGLTVADLRIGDEFNFRTKVFLENGEVYYFNRSMGELPVVVQCGSDLEGQYTVEYGSGPATHTVTEVAPGRYEMDGMFGWPGAGGNYTVEFTDVCGTLTLVPEWAFSNAISGTGYVDEDGNLVWTSVSVEAVYDGSKYTMIKQ